MSTATALADTEHRIDVVRLYLDAVATTPDRVAVVAPEVTLTFAELDQRVRTLAGALVARGIGPGTRVGVQLPRSAHLVVALLATWRAGAAYVPLDPAHPPARQAFMCGDAGVATVLIDQANLRLGANVATFDVTGLDTVGAAPVLPLRTAPDDAAYVIYTSGSTGQPKGVVVNRGAVANLVAALTEAGLYAPAPRVVAWNASVSFDASVQQWARVCRGDTLVLVEEDHRTEPAAFARHLREHGVTDLDVTPSHWAVLREHLVPAERPSVPLRLFVGGEPVPPGMWTDLADATDRGLIEAVNLYGPTESTVDATVAWIRGGESHIGAALPGVRAYVLDEDLRPAPPGVAGELFLAGAGVADGYASRPALTAGRFLPDLVAGDGGRMYATGDRVRQRADGAFTYLGRADGQVKVNGHRIELGEVEAALSTHASVAATAAAVVGGKGAGRFLHAYYTCVPGADPAEAELSGHLAARLPGYMVPSAVLRLPRMPITRNGKIDRAALVAHSVERAEEVRTEISENGGVSPLERLIATAWANVLGRRKIGLDDDFFMLGGHSLMALRVVAAVKKETGVVLPTKSVYRHPKLRDLARHVARLQMGGSGDQ